MSKHFGTIRNLIAISALALAGAAGCATDGESSVESNSTGRGTGSAEAPGDGPIAGPGTGGSCADVLTHGCDGATGQKLEACKADLQNAYAECLKYEACLAERDAVAQLCAPKDEACLAKAEEVLYACIGPVTAPGTQPSK